MRGDILIRTKSPTQITPVPARVSHTGFPPRRVLESFCPFMRAGVRIGMQQESEAATRLADKPPKKINLKSLRAKVLIAAIILTVGMSAAVPFFFSRPEVGPGGARVRRLIITHDLWMHLHTMEQFDKALRSGVIYPRWVADINHGYGILTLIYYPPGLYY